MKVVYFYVLLCVFLSNCKLIGKELYIDGKNEAYQYNSVIIPINTGDILTYFDFNVLDNDINTCVAINTNVNFWEPRKGKRAAFFKIILKKKYKIDKIVIWNGFQKSSDLYMKNSRVKEVYIEARDNNNYKKRPDYFTNISLIDSTNSQDIIFPTPIEGDNISFSVLSTYPGTKYGDICLSEMEFWYKGGKYKVANLGAAKRDYVNAYIDRTKLLLADKNLIIGINDKGFRKIQSTLGWPDIEIERRHVGIQFRKDGSIYVWFPYEYEMEEGKNYGKGVLGKWKYDDKGRLHIKLGKEDWEMWNGNGVFKGTDLEGKQFGPLGLEDEEKDN